MKFPIIPDQPTIDATYSFLLTVFFYIKDVQRPKKSRRCTIVPEAAEMPSNSPLSAFNLIKAPNSELFKGSIFVS